MPQTSKYFMPLIWLAITLVQVGDIRLYSASLQLLEVILKTLDYTECFKDLVRDNTQVSLLLSSNNIQELSQFVMTVREGAMDNLLTKLDMITGISFKNSFSFAIATHLLKGLRHPQTKTSTSRVLSSFVDISARKAVGPNLLGFIAALLPTKGDEMSNLRQLFPSEGNTDVAPTHYFFSELVSDLLSCFYQLLTPHHRCFLTLRTRCCCLLSWSRFFRTRISSTSSSSSTSRCERASTACPMRCTSLMKCSFQRYVERGRRRKFFFLQLTHQFL